MSSKKQLEKQQRDGIIVKSHYFDDLNCTNKKIKFVESTLKPIGPRAGLPFFNVDCENLAKSLLGSVLVRLTHEKTVLRGVIVETESYLGGEDKASFSYGGKKTERNRPMYMTPGTTFVYTTYGMYNLINISSKGKMYPASINALSANG